MFRKSASRLVILLAALTLAGPGARAQQPAPSFKDTTAFPEGPAGARIKSLITVMNSGNADRVKRFIEKESGT